MSPQKGPGELLAERARLTWDKARPPCRRTCASLLGDDQCLCLLWRRSDWLGPAEHPPDKCTVWLTCTAGQLSLRFL